MLASRKEEVNHAVNEALAKDRRKRNNINSRDCPPCDPCHCNNGQKQQRGGGVISVAECNAKCDRKIDVAATASSSSGAPSSDKTTCTPSYLESESSSASNHEIIQKMLVSMEGLMGPSAMMLLLLGCTLATMLYIFKRMITALFFSTGPNVRTYYHTREDDEREKIMMQNVSYYRSPTPPSRGTTSRQSPGSASSSTASGPRPPPTASMSAQRSRNGGIFSPHENRRAGNGTTPTPQQQSSPFSGSDGTDSIYQSMSPITPLRNGGGTTPSASSSAGSQGSSGQRSSRYNNY